MQPSKKHIRIVLVVLMLAAVFPDCVAQNWRTFSTPQGLVGDEVLDIAVDRNGDIWFASNKGISRFNGDWVSFNLQDGLLSANITSIAQDLDGNLWFGTVDGIMKIDPDSELSFPGNWVSYTTETTGLGLGHNHVTSIVIDHAGLLWFGTNGGGVSVADPTPDPAAPSGDPLRDPDNWVMYTEEDGLSSNFVFSSIDNPLSNQRLLEDGDGNIWAATTTAISIFERSRSAWREFDLPELESRLVTALFRDDADRVWIGTTSSGLYRSNPGNRQTYDDHFTMDNVPGLASNSIVSIGQDNNGIMWFGHEVSGTSFFLTGDEIQDESNWSHFTTADGLGWNKVSAIAVDHEENIWFGHEERRGASSFNGAWSSFLFEEEINSKILLGDSERTIWVNVRDGVNRINLDANLMFPKNLSTVFGESSGLSSNQVFDMLQDSQDRLWFANQRGVDRVHISDVSEPTRWVHHGPEDGFQFEMVDHIEEDRAGFLWFVTLLAGQRKIYRVRIEAVDDTSKWQLITSDLGLVSEMVSDVLQARRGSENKLWFATDDGISSFDPSQDPTNPQNWQTFTPENSPLFHKFVRSIFEDSDGKLWFATEGGGVARVNPDQPSEWSNFTQQNTNNGLISDFVTSVAQRKDNEFWFGTAVGASRFELDHNRWSQFTTQDGLRANSIISLFVDRDREGIWFGTFGGGVTRYQPKAGKPQTAIERTFDVITANQIRFEFNGADVVTGQKELRFQYWLDNRDTVETADNFATFSLPPSHRPQRHVFQVRAIDRDGNIDPSPATDVFYRVNPSFGGRIESVDTTDFFKKVELFIPPSELTGERSVQIEAVPDFELPDSLVVTAFDLNGQGNLAAFSRPATLAMSVVSPDLSPAEPLAIFRELANGQSEAVGGKVATRGDTITVTTAIKELGRYAIRLESATEVAEARKIMSIQPKVISPRTPDKGFGAAATISFTLDAASDVTLKVYDVGGKIVRTLMESHRFLPGVNAVEWDGTDRDGNPCRSGLYVVLIDVDGKPETQAVMVANSFK